MRLFSKLPFYLGLGFLIVTVLVSAIKIGSGDTDTSTQSQASLQGASLVMQDVENGKVSVFLITEKAVAGVDVVVSFNPEEITVLPTSLANGPTFITAGGIVNDQSGEFAFSAIPNGEDVTSGIVGYFTLEGREGNTVPFESNVQFVLQDGKTAVLQAGSGQNILQSVKGADITISQ